MRVFVSAILFASVLPLTASPYKKGVKLNSFFRFSSAAPIAFLEKHGITLADIFATSEPGTPQDKELLPLLKSLQASDFPYAFFYTNESMFTRRFPGMFGIKVGNPSWMALIRIGADKNAKGQKPLRNRFYPVEREGLVMEILPDGILMLPAEDVATAPEIKTLQELHDAILKDLDIKADDTAFMEFHEKSAFSDINERFKMLLDKRAPGAAALTNNPVVENIVKRVLRNPFLKAMLSTRQSSARFDLKDGFTMSGEYTLGDPAHKEAFLKSMSAMQVLGSIATTVGIAAWDVQAAGQPARTENARIGMDLLEKLSESFEKMRIEERAGKISLTWQFVNGKDLIPAMRLAKKLIEQKKEERREVERAEMLRDEICIALKQKNRETFRTKISAYADKLPAEEYKIWRIRQTCEDGSGILLSALDFGGEDSFLKLIRRLKYHTGNAALTTTTGKGYLHIAVQKRYDQALKQILDDGMLADEPDATGKTALIYAIETKNTATVKLLLDRGVKIISDADTTLAKKTLDAAEASGNPQIRAAIEAALQKERAFRKKHQTQS